MTGRRGVGPCLEEVDLVGVGYGPANLSLAVALEEVPDALRPRAVFLERQPGFGWHRDMLLPGATIQISFLKDVVSLRNPRSPHGFVSYLHERDRLLDFINGDMHPTRREFHDYLAWVSDHVSSDVRYGAEVVRLDPVEVDGGVTHLDVVHRDPGGARTRAIRARSVVLGMGLVPHLPEGVAESARVFHSDGFLGRLPGVGARPRRLLVAGAGQSAAEVARHLHASYPSSEVLAVLPHFGYSVADDTPFVNQVFDPVSTDTFHAARSSARQDILRQHANTNYSVVDRQLIEDLYSRAYQEKVEGEPRLRIVNLTRLTAARQHGDVVRVRLLDEATGESFEEVVDAVVCATGYRPFSARHWLAGLGDLVCWEDDEPRVGRDYRVSTDPSMSAAVYLQGPTEGSHGLSSTLLSNVAVRAGEIVAALLATEGGQGPGGDRLPSPVSLRAGGR